MNYPSASVTFNSASISTGSASVVYPTQITPEYVTCPKCKLRVPCEIQGGYIFMPLMSIIYHQTTSPTCGMAAVVASACDDIRSMDIKAVQAFVNTQCGIAALQDF